jgi:hypothetical protein
LTLYFRTEAKPDGNGAKGGPGLPVKVTRSGNCAAQDTGDNVPDDTYHKSVFDCAAIGRRSLGDPWSPTVRGTVHEATIKRQSLKR